MVSSQKIVFTTLVIISLSAVVKVNGASKNFLTEVSVMNCLPKERKAQIESAQKCVPCKANPDKNGNLKLAENAKSLCFTHCQIKTKNTVIQLNEVITNFFVAANKIFPVNNKSEPIIKTALKPEFGSQCVQPKDKTRPFLCLCSTKYTMHGTPIIKSLIQNLGKYITSETMKKFDLYTFIRAPEIRNHKSLKNCIVGLDDNKNQSKKSDNRNLQRQTKKSGGQQRLARRANSTLKLRIFQFLLVIAYVLIITLMYLTPVQAFPINNLIPTPTTSMVIWAAIVFIVMVYDVFLQNIE